MKDNNTRQVELFAVKEPRQLFKTQVSSAAESSDGPLAKAKGAVPLLWLALFDYADVKVTGVDRVDVPFATVPVSDAVQRAEALREALARREPASLYTAARGLAAALRALDQSLHLAIFPVRLFTELRGGRARGYLQQLVQLCDVWEGLRAGDATWETTLDRLRLLAPDIDSTLKQPDTRVVHYYLLGDLDVPDEMDELMIRYGQDREDLDPEALVVGEQGLVLGRFDGDWKLMHSATNADLLGVWAIDDTAYVVGRDGTLIVMRDGECEQQTIPTTHGLNAVFGFSPQSVCVVGDRGTVIAFNGQRWQPWPVPTEVSLNCVWGSDPENLFVGGQDTAILRYDGYGWTRMPLPTEGFINQFSALGEQIFAVGGTRTGAQLLTLDRDGWESDYGLPPAEWLEGLWTDWDQVGVTPRVGAGLTKRERAWVHEPIPADEILSSSSGAFPMAVGKVGKHSVILSRAAGAWEIEAAFDGLQLNAIWVRGRPKPPRISNEKEDETD